MKLANKTGCLINDRISVELSPLQVEKLIDKFKDGSVAAKDFDEQSACRSWVSLLEPLYEAWEDARNVEDGHK